MILQMILQGSLYSRYIAYGENPIHWQNIMNQKIAKIKLIAKRKERVWSTSFNLPSS